MVDASFEMREGKEKKTNNHGGAQKKRKKKAWLRRANTRGNTAQHTTDGSVNSPRGGLNARPLLLGEAGDGAVGVNGAGDLADGFVESGESRGFADGLHGELQLVVGPSGAATGVGGGHTEQVVESVARLARRRGAGCSSAQLAGGCRRR